MYSHKIFLVNTNFMGNKLELLIVSNVNQKKIKSSRKEYVMWIYFKFWPMKSIFQKLQANESLIIACLQIYRELLSLMTFLRVHSNSKEVSYLPWQNTYPNLKTTCHIKLNFLFWNWTHRKLNPWKISHICHCAFNVKSAREIKSILPKCTNIISFNLYQSSLICSSSKYSEFKPVQKQSVWTHSYA